MLPGLPQVGGLELLILVSIILLFFGAGRLPQLGRSLGTGIREFRQGISGAANGNKGEVRDKKKDEEEPSQNEEAHGEVSRPEDEEAARTEQKS